MPSKELHLSWSVSCPTRKEASDNTLIWVTDRSGRVRAELAGETRFYWENGRTRAWAHLQLPEPFDWRKRVPQRTD